MHGLEKEYGSRITFVRANILMPESEPLMKQYGFSATPEFYLVDQHDKIIGAWDDFVTAEDLKQAFDAALKASQ